MSHSQRLTLHDMRDVMRLLGEVRELGHDPARWRGRAILGLCRLVDAPVGMSVEAYGWEAASPRPAVLVHLGWAGDHEREVYLSWLRSDEFLQHPARDALAASVGASFTRERRRLVDDGSWYGSRVVNEFQREAKVDDFIFSNRVLPTDGNVAGTDQMTLHRPWGGRPFGVRERRMVALFHHELRRLWEPQAPEAERPDDPVATLPPHLRQTLTQLLAGHSEKEAARNLGRSRHTVHSYVKALYRRLGVGSRGELLARHRPAHAFTPRLVGPSVLGSANGETGSVA